MYDWVSGVPKSGWRRAAATNANWKTVFTCPNWYSLESGIKERKTITCLYTLFSILTTCCVLIYEKKSYFLCVGGWVRS